ncbi:tRNA lysidine(34) synthetase TilS [Nisaea denitrificans]|uniref:tRNA lysidine(34) synthetase TilS n=1 Tax=Nisaea denitrificans TaxID=390877 RepID=UPI0003F99238|nr:tRNA lysidine(34) synthetase TilS [Nisaea denitrificans]
MKPVSDSEFEALLKDADPALASAGPSVFIAGVSGGADSMALCLMLAHWCRARGHRLVAVTVDHALRADSAAEARRVSGWLAARGIEHEILSWSGTKPSAGLQAAARSARFALLTDHALSLGAQALFLAHHMQDQAETMAMRLARGSGPDGLAGIRPRQMRGGIAVLRPLLGLPPVRLRAHCLAEAQAWVEDPSNRDRRFERVRVRQSAQGMTDAGLDAHQLNRLARVFGRLRDWSEARLAGFLTEFADLDPRGFAVLDRSAALNLPLPLRAKLLSGLLQSIGGLDYPPRAERMKRFLRWLDDGVGDRVTLGGCLVWRGRSDRLWIARETPRETGPEMLRSQGVSRWDGRFDVTWSGAQPAWIHMLERRGERRLRLTGAAAKTSVALPAGIRASLPAVTDLDGRLFAPHLSDTWTSRRPLEAGLFHIEFRPAVPWVADAFRASRDDRAVTND